MHLQRNHNSIGTILFCFIHQAFSQVHQKSKKPIGHEVNTITTVIASIYKPIPVLSLSINLKFYSQYQFDLTNFPTKMCL